MNKSVLITGGTRGIGEAISREFAKKGYDIIINYVNSSEKAQNLKQELEKEYNIKVLPIQADISNEIEIKNMVDTAIKEFGKIDVLVNNAGIVIDREFEDRTVEDWKKTLDINLIAPFVLIKLVGKEMMKQKSGSIINISSTNGLNTYYPPSVDYDASKSGLINPVAVFEPVNLEGALTTRATLHNITYIKKMMLGIGDRIRIYRSNKVIPKVHESIDKSGNFTIPSTCPICGGETKIVKENDSEVLICTNPTCVGKLLGRLSHAVSRNALNIEGFSEATIDKFISLGWLKSIKDIYHLKDYELRMKNLEGFGSKSVTKLLASIENSRKTTLDRFLYSLSIPLLGKTASKAIAQAEDYNFNSFAQDMIHPGAEFFRNIPGIGDSLINSLNQYFSRDCYEIYALAEEFEFQNPKPIFKMLGVKKDLTGKTFVITGSLEHFSNRDEAKAQIESLGGKVSGSVSAKTSYLVNNDPNSTSSKNVKAKKLNVPIISEKELLSMIS